MSNCRRILGLLLTACATLALIGCAHSKPPVTIGACEDRMAALEVERDRLQKILQDREGTLHQLQTARRRLGSEIDRLKAEKGRLEVEIGRLQMQLLEGEIRHRALAEETVSQRDMLDEAVLEVVRTKARLHSIESRAEAASSITEAEIALQALKESPAGSKIRKVDDLKKAEGLLHMSTAEFKKENFGGALYLAGQARTRIRILQKSVLPRDEVGRKSGEVTFDQPLPLKVLKRSHLRAGPSLQSPIERTLDPGTLVVGHAYKEKWVRVRTDDGGEGWIFQILLGGR